MAAQVAAAQMETSSLMGVPYLLWRNEKKVLHCWIQVLFACCLLSHYVGLGEPVTLVSYAGDVNHRAFQGRAKRVTLD